MFFIPKYQRAYAWEAESVNDFTKDLKGCFERRKAGSAMNHFFGGILSVKYSVPGAVNQHRYEIIDGQQRIATFVILVACLIEVYEKLLFDARTAKDTTNELIIKGRIDKLYERFIEFNQEVQRVITPIEVLELSSADKGFFKEIIRRMNSNPSRESHRRIAHAYNSIRKVIVDIANLHARVEDKLDELEIFQNIIDNDFTILHMVTGNRGDAYRLFQVINDRGTSLTDGDLLRAKTLEMLEGDSFHQYQDAVERLWDDILVDDPSSTNDYLNWMYESYRGSRPPQNTLFDKFLEGFFPQNQSLNLSLQQAQAVQATVQRVYNDFTICKMLVEGQWPFSTQQPVTSWDRTRLSILLVELGHTLSIPLLLAASQLDHRKFSQIVQVIERAFFRYKVICNQHVTPLKNIYAQEALDIRSNPSTYSVLNLKNKLQKLIDDRASDVVFRNGLMTLEYQETGGSNKPLKYFLMTLEYYYQWYKSGAVGAPECVDKSRLYDFAGTSIEHIYPKRAGSAVVEATLEPLKQSLGNLMILSIEQNNIGDDDPFMQKRMIYQQSSVVFAQEIGKKANWAEHEIEIQRNLYIDIALKVFRP